MDLYDEFKSKEIAFINKESKITNNTDNLLSVESTGIKKNTNSISNMINVFQSSMNAQNKDQENVTSNENEINRLKEQIIA